MADTHHKSEQSITQHLREAVVGYRPNRGRPNPPAQICLSGHWLQQAGFETGLPLDIRVMPGCQVITARPEEPPLPLTRQVLNRTGTLPDKAQQELCILVNALLIREGLGAFKPEANSLNEK